MRYNRPVFRSNAIRRAFLKWLVGLAGAAALLPHPPARPSPAALSSAPPTPLAPNPTTSEAAEYFVPLEHYHELPPECYQANLIQPLEIIIHWDGNRQGRDLWVTAVTYETLKLVRQSAHFAVDHSRVWQLLPMYRTVVQESHGAQGYNWAAINIEMAGVYFDRPENYPPETEIRQTVHLTSQLMDFYDIAFEHVVGHFERDDRGLKEDPGVKFMADFRTRLQTYRASLSPVKHQFLSNHP